MLVKLVLRVDLELGQEHMLELASSSFYVYRAIECIAIDDDRHCC